MKAETEAQAFKEILQVSEARQRELRKARKINGLLRESLWFIQELAEEDSVDMKVVRKKARNALKEADQMDREEDLL